MVGGSVGARIGGRVCQQHAGLITRRRTVRFRGPQPHSLAESAALPLSPIPGLVHEAGPGWSRVAEQASREIGAGRHQRTHTRERPRKGKPPHPRRPAGRLVLPRGATPGGNRPFTPSANSRSGCESTTYARSICPRAEGLGDPDRLAPSSGVRLHPTACRERQPPASRSRIGRARGAGAHAGG